MSQCYLLLTPLTRVMSILIILLQVSERNVASQSNSTELLFFAQQVSREASLKCAEIDKVFSTVSKPLHPH